MTLIAVAPTVDEGYTRTEAIDACGLALLAAAPLAKYGLLSAPFSLDSAILSTWCETIGRASPISPGVATRLKFVVRNARKTGDSLPGSGGGTDTYAGLYEVTIFAPTNGGRRLVHRLADAILDAFPAGAEARAGTYVVEIGDGDPGATGPNPATGELMHQLSFDWTLRDRNPLPALSPLG